jgi:putative ABC transport system permease protein
VLLTDGQASPVGIGMQITVTGVPGSPRLTVVGTAMSVTHTAAAWVAPAQIAALRAPGAPDLAQMLYRFARAGTTAQVTADIAALRAALPPGALIGAQSWLTVPLPATGAIAPWSWWKQVVCDSCILIGLGVLILIVIKDFATLPGTPGVRAQRARWHHHTTRNLGPAPSGTSDDASVPAPT